MNDDKLHHLINVLRIRNNSPIKISNGKGILFFGKLKDNNIQLSSKKESRHQRIERALRNNLRKRKVFQNKISKRYKKNKK